MAKKYQLFLLIFLFTIPVFAINDSEIVFYSESLKKDVPVRIYLPPSYFSNNKKRYPVLYFLHSYNNKTDDEDFNRKHFQNFLPDSMNGFTIAEGLMRTSDLDLLEEFLKNMQISYYKDISDNAGEFIKENGINTAQDENIIEEMILVSPYGGNSFYADRFDKKPCWPPEDLKVRGRTVKAGSTGMFESYIINDLIQYIDNNYRTVRNRCGRFVTGTSMGGLGAIKFGFKYYKLFGSVSVISGQFAISWLSGIDRWIVEMYLPELYEVFGDSNKLLVKSYMNDNDPFYLIKKIDKLHSKFYFEVARHDIIAFLFTSRLKEEFEKRGFKSYPAAPFIKQNEFSIKSYLKHGPEFYRTRIGMIYLFHSNEYRKWKRNNSCK